MAHIMMPVVTKGRVGERNGGSGYRIQIESAANVTGDSDMTTRIIAYSIVLAVGAGGIQGVAGEPLRRAEQVDRIERVSPISAFGVVRAHELIAIKSKSSGRIQDVFVEEGQTVKKGDVLVQLDCADEHRTVQRLLSELDRGTAIYEQSLIRLREARQNRPLDVESQQQTVEEARSTRDERQMDVDRLRDLGPDLKGPTEDQKAILALNRAAAILAREEVVLRRAKNNLPILIETAEQEVIANDAWLRSIKGQLDDAQARLDDTIIASPIDGMICNINVRRGELIQSGMYGLGGGTSLMQLADVSRMSVVAHVTTSDVCAIRNIAPDFAQPGRVRNVSEDELFGMLLPPTVAAKPAERRVKVVAAVYPNESFEGVIERLVPEMHTAVDGTASLEVRIRLKGPDLARLMGLEVRVDFPADRKTHVLRVKNDALVREGSDTFVAVSCQDAAGKVERERKVKVQTGPTEGDYTEIVSGLGAEDKVLVRLSEPVEEKKPAMIAPILGAAPATLGIQSK
jgi:HlyD family secretion protein